MPKPSVLIVYKRSALSRYQLKRPRAILNDVLKRILKESHTKHHESLMGVREILAQRGFRVFRAFRSSLSRIKNIDERFKFVVTVGGDGTFLETAHHLVRTPLLGVNSDPAKSVARFSACATDGLSDILDQYGSGRLEPVALTRLQLKLQGKALSYKVLNDVLVTAHCPAEASRYWIKVKGKTEEQMSSGVWISTAVGSTAASASAGGRILPERCKCFQYVVREVYHRKTGRRRLLNQVLYPGEKIELISRMRDGEIYVDGASLRVPFELGSKLGVSISKYPLKVIGLKKI